MKKGLIGKKLGMTQVYSETGDLIPVTAIQLGPCPVLAVRTQEKDNYSALQLGFGSRKAKNLTKADLGHLKASKQEATPPAIIREIRLDADPTQEVGAVLGVADVFAAKEFVDVTGITKGRGFAGVVRRWNFNGGRATHGCGWVRRSGSIGMREKPGKIYKGRHMAGHMGNVKRTVQNLLVVDVRADSNIMLVKGGIPGTSGGYVIVKNSVKK